MNYIKVMCIICNTLCKRFIFETFKLSTYTIKNFMEVLLLTFNFL
jgi:hypothetical protein